MIIPNGLFRAWVVAATMWLGIGFLLLVTDSWYRGITATSYTDLTILLAVPTTSFLGLWLASGFCKWAAARLRRSEPT